MEEKKGLLEKTVERIIFSVFILILLITIVQNISFLFETMSSVNVMVLLGALLLFALAAVLLICSKADPQKMVIVAVAVGFALRLVYAFEIRTEPASDFNTMLVASRKVIQGNYDFLEGNYFSRWPYQIPFVFFQSLLLRIHDSVKILQIANVLFMAGSCILVYRIAAKYVSDKAAAIVCIGYSVYPAPILMSSVLTNQHVSLFFLLWGVDLFLGSEKWHLALFSGVCLCIGNLLRPDGILILATLFCAGLFYGVVYVCKREKALLQILWKTAICMVTFLLLTNGIKFLFSLTPLGANGIDNNYPEWKFILGLNTETYGAYQSKDVDILSIEDDKIRRQETVKRIREYFEDTSRLDFFSNKTKRMWAVYETEAWSMDHLDRSREAFAGQSVQWVVDQLMIVDKGMYLFVFSLTLLSALYAFLKKNRHMVFLLISVLFIGNYISYLFIEIQTRYRYFIMPFLFIGAAYAIDILIEKKMWAKQN